MKPHLLLFYLLFNVKKIFSFSFCNGLNPDNSTVCNQLNNFLYNCCYLTAQYGGGVYNMCYAYKAPNNSLPLTTLNFDGFVFNATCGDNDPSLITKDLLCGNYDPLNATDCGSGGPDCCYYQDQGVSFCIDKTVNDHPAFPLVKNDLVCGSFFIGFRSFVMLALYILYFYNI